MDAGRVLTEYRPAATAAAGSVVGRLDLEFVARAPGAGTEMRAIHQTPPLRVVRAFRREDGSALVHLHNVSGGVCGGDHLKIGVRVGERATAQVTTTGATRLYRARTGAEAAVQVTEAEVGAGGLLEYLPDPIIPFAGSRYRQETRIRLSPGAGLFWWETVAPGREARGEVFEYTLYQAHLDILAGDTPIAVERIRLEPRIRPLPSPARMGPYRYLSSMYVCRMEAGRDWRDLEDRLNGVAQLRTVPGEAVWGVSALVAHGVVVRGLCRTGRGIPDALMAFWQESRRGLYGREAIPPRKVH